LLEVKNEALASIAARTARYWTTWWGAMRFVTGMGVLIIWLFGGRAVLGGEISLGTLMAFYSYMWLLYGPMHWFGQVANWMTRAFAGAERIFEVVDAPPEAYDDPDAVSLPRFLIDPSTVRDGRVRLNDAEAKHARVRRLRSGDAVVVFDGAGLELGEAP